MTEDIKGWEHRDAIWEKYQATKSLGKTADYIGYKFKLDISTSQCKKIIEVMGNKVNAMYKQDRSHWKNMKACKR